MALLARMKQLVGQHSQFIIATHSPIVMAYPDSVIYQLGGGGLTAVNYEDTEHYQITRRFLNNPRAALDALFEDE
jgi:predicted ATPase